MSALRAVDSNRWCHAEFRHGPRPSEVLRCQLPIGHDGSHASECTRWVHDDRRKAAR